MAAGVCYVPDAEVTGFRFAGGDGRKVVGLETSRGPIEAETVVLAAGLWTSELARLAGASVALYPAEHVWVMTEEAAGAAQDAPFLRDLDGSIYIRQYRGRYVIGAFEPNGKPIAPSAVPSTGFAEFGPDWDHFAPALAAARQRVPELESIGFAHFLRAPESFTPDSNFQLGFVPEFDGLFVAAGLNSQGIIFAPGVGRAAAEWIVEGHPTMDLEEVDVARMERWMNQPAWLHERTEESLGGLYELHWPGKQPRTGRDVRRVPLYDQLRATGAAFGQAAGWERANWFEPGVVDPKVRYDFADPSWFPSVREEVAATREAVALYDLSTYAKFYVHGPEALDGLQGLATSDLDVALGRIVYTLLCNERGGIEMDPTITRVAEDRFLVLAPTLTQRRTEALLRRGLPSSVVTDATSELATLHLAGPRSRELLARLTDADVSAAAWPFLRAREIEVGRGARVGVPCFVHRGAGLGTVAAYRSRRGSARAGRCARAPGSGCATRGPSRSTPHGWSADSGRGATISGLATIRSRPGSGSRSRTGRPPISWAAQRSSGCAPPSLSSASSAFTPPTPCCGTASHCSATANERATSRAPRSRPPSAVRPASAGSTARSMARGRWRSAATPFRVG